MSLAIETDFKQWLDNKYLDSITATYLKMMEGANDFAVSNGITDLNIYDFIIPESFKALSTDILSLLSHTPITDENFLKMKAALDEFSAFIGEEGRFSQEALEEAREAINKDAQEREAREKRLEEERARKRAEEEAKKKEMLSLFSSVTVAEEVDEGENNKGGDLEEDSTSDKDENAVDVQEKPHHVFKVIKHSKTKDLPKLTEEESELLLDESQDVTKTGEKPSEESTEETVVYENSSEPLTEEAEIVTEENTSQPITSSEIVEDEESVESVETEASKELEKTEKKADLSVEETPQEEIQEKEDSEEAIFTEEPVVSDQAQVEEDEQNQAEEKPVQITEEKEESEILTDTTPGEVVEVTEEPGSIKMEENGSKETQEEKVEEVPAQEAAHIRPHTEYENETDGIITTAGEGLFTKAELFDAFFSEDEDELDFFNSLASLDIEEDERENEPAFESFISSLGSFSNESEEKPSVSVEDEETEEVIQAADEIEEENILTENAENESAYETFVKEDEAEADNLGSEEELQDFFASLNLTNPYDLEEAEEIEIPIELENLPSDEDEQLEVEDFFNQLKVESPEDIEESESAEEDYNLIHTFTTSEKQDHTLGYVPFHAQGKDQFEPAQSAVDEMKNSDSESENEKQETESLHSEQKHVSQTLGYVPYKADRNKKTEENEINASLTENKEETEKPQVLLEDTSNEEKLIEGTEPLSLEGETQQDSAIELGGPIELNGSVSSMKLEDSLKDQQKLEETEEPLEIEGTTEENTIELGEPIEMEGSVSSMKLEDSLEDQQKLEETEESLEAKGQIDNIELNEPIEMEGSVSSMKLEDSHKDQKMLEESREPLGIEGETQEECPIELEGPIEMGGTIEMEGPTEETEHSLGEDIADLGAGIASVFSPESEAEKVEEKEEVEEVKADEESETSTPANVQVEEGVTEEGQDSLEVELPADHSKPVTEAVKAVTVKTQGTLNDYVHPALLTPESFSIGEKAPIQVKDWEELYVRLIDELTYLDRKNMAALLSYSTGSRIRKPRMTATGYVIETDLKPEVMVRNLDAMLSLCMIDPSDIRLSFLNE